MTKTVFVNPHVLAAMAAFASDEVTRPYLMCVHVRGSSAGTIYEATDGHVAMRYTDPSQGQTESVAIMVPLALCKRSKALISSVAVVTQDNDMVRVECEFETVAAVEIDGTYPDVERAYPKETSGETGQFNPELLMRFMTFAKAMRKPLGLKETPLPYVHHNGPKDPAVVTFKRIEGALGVVMPHAGITGEGWPA